MFFHNVARPHSTHSTLEHLTPSGTPASPLTSLPRPIPNNPKKQPAASGAPLPPPPPLSLLGAQPFAWPDRSCDIPYPTFSERFDPPAPGVERSQSCPGLASAHPADGPSASRAQSFTTLHTHHHLRLLLFLSRELLPSALLIRNHQPAACLKAAAPPLALHTISSCVCSPAPRLYQQTPSCAHGVYYPTMA